MLTVKYSELSENRQGTLNRHIESGLKEGSCHMDSAAKIRDTLEVKDGREWACVVGKDFGALVSHHPGSYHHVVGECGSSVVVWRYP